MATEKNLQPYELLRRGYEETEKQTKAPKAILVEIAEGTKDGQKGE